MKPYLVERWQPPALQPIAPARLHNTTAAAGGDHE
jgi:hypothetical protein